MFRVLFLILVLMSSAAFSLISKTGNSASPKSVAPVPAPTSFTPIDRIGKASDKDIIARFDAVRIGLENDPTSTAYIINYGTGKQIRKRERQFRKAFAFHKIERKRITMVSGGNNGILETVIYVIPAEVKPPNP